MGGTDMDNDGMDMSIMGASSIPEMFMNGSFKSLFHVNKGMLRQWKGALSTETKMSGLSMKATPDVIVTCT